MGQGYALRELKDDFLKKYKVLYPEAKNLEDLVAYLSDRLGASQRDWQIGTSKVRHLHVLYFSLIDTAHAVAKSCSYCSIFTISNYVRYSFGATT